MFVPPDIEQIPVDRLVTNLGRLVRERPGDVKLLYNLGRTHAMAYALKTDTLAVWRGRENDGPWLGYEPAHMHPDVKMLPGAKPGDAARRHLDAAAALYEKALAIDPANAPVLLSLGWAHVQAGEKDKAIVRLREVVRIAWPADRKAEMRMVGWRSLTEEAARYLIPLLDPVADRIELGALRDRLAELERMPRAITPIAVPLGAGLSAIDITVWTARVRFDADGSGLQRRWTWITPDAGWLVYDHRGARQIGSALQMFGSVSFWLFWDTGYDALAALDDDGDGRIAGQELGGLAIWRDSNVDGVSDPGEVRPVSAWGIVSLSFDYEIDGTHPDEIAFAPRGATFRDGTSRPTFDIVLHRR
jgi:tetratricopeptide (TPR) repeat protein